MLMIAVPGERELRLEHLVLDANGTLTDRGALLDGVADAVRALRAHMRCTSSPLTRSARLNVSPSSSARHSRASTPPPQLPDPAPLPPA